MSDSQQTKTETSDSRSKKMIGKQQSVRIESAPLYASPWLAFYTLIRQGLAQLWP